ncbi:NAD(P)H-binding [Nonomuraea solani]|uniref:NAD(P)H-binding n=1 Tax=Nonomuraea solani TaxID=1144553 RepID=A0A1H6F173_9ACTN|nr:NAD(P)H-binding protein [Nonomuraea solani]SEH03908.1 NAD(P)H-binding [Nonomuraea solani]
MILITGATGNVGSELIITLLAARNVSIRAMTRNPAKATFPVDVGDFDQPDTLAAALDGVEKVFILPPAAPTRNAPSSPPPPPTWSNSPPAASPQERTNSRERLAVTTFITHRGPLPSPQAPPAATSQSSSALQNSAVPEVHLV